ncbi:MAG: ester cyclase [Chloroflexota bacterium]
MNEEVLRQFSRLSAEAAFHDTLTHLSTEGLVPWDETVIDRLVAPEYVHHSPLGDLDREAYKAFFEALHSTLAAFNMVRVQLVLEGGFAAARTVVSGTFVHSFPGPTFTIPPTNKPIELQIVNLFYFNADAQIVEEWAQFDYLGFLTQLGVQVSLRSLNALPQC